VSFTGFTAFIELAPCDVVMADIQARMPDPRLIALPKICRDLQDRLT
jgi:hypothetical protein